MFEISAESGDATLKAGADSAEGLFRELALGFSALSRGGAEVRPLEKRRVSLSAPDGESLLVNFLNELVFLLDTQGFLPAGLEGMVSLAGNACRLEAELPGETAAPGLRQDGTLAKAATYHALKLELRDGTWRAEVTLDL